MSRTLVPEGSLRKAAPSLFVSNGEVGGPGQAGFLFLSVLAIRLHAAATCGGGVIKVGL